MLLTESGPDGGIPAHPGSGSPSAPSGRTRHQRQRVVRAVGDAGPGARRIGATDLVDRLRRHRSRLLWVYTVGSCLVIALAVIDDAATRNRPIRVIPQAQALNRETPRTMDPGIMRFLAEFIIARLHTWSYVSLDQAVDAVLPYIDPSVRDHMAGDALRERREATRSRLSCLALPLASTDHGIHQGVQTIWVAYERLEATGQQPGSDVHRHSDAIAIMDFVRGVPMPGNVFGIYLIKLQDFDAEAWKARGGRDLWRSLRQGPSLFGTGP